MALELYLKDLVGATSDIQIVDDNSMSTLPLGLLDHSFREDSLNAEDNNFLSRPSHSGANVPSQPQGGECPRTPSKRRDSNNRIIGLRERQRLVRLNISPSLSLSSPRSPSGRNGRRDSSPPPPGLFTPNHDEHDSFSPRGKQKQRLRKGAFLL